MYLPVFTVVENQELERQLIDDYPLGLLISKSGEKFQTSYLPFIVVKEDNEFFLLGHLAKANPHWRALAGDALISFQGPNCYISPTNYFNKLNVPTWNYAVVQVHGSVEIISDRNGLNQILNKITEVFENKNSTNWSYDLPLEMQTELESAIIGLKIKVLRFESKFKLSQNRSAEDYDSVLAKFKTSSNDRDQQMYEWMLKSKPEN